MTEQGNTHTINILNKSYQITCPPEEQAALQASAAYLDKKMREIQSGGKIVGLEKIAVMAALNISYELLEKKQQHESTSSTVADHQKLKEHLASLQIKVQEAIEKNRITV